MITRQCAVEDVATIIMSGSAETIMMIAVSLISHPGSSPVLCRGFRDLMDDRSRGGGEEGRRRGGGGDEKRERRGTREMKEERRRTKEISEVKIEIERGEEEEVRRRVKRSEERRGTRELREEATTKGERRGTREIQEEVAMALAMRGGVSREEKKERRMSREVVGRGETGETVTSRGERRATREMGKESRRGTREMNEEELTRRKGEGVTTVKVEPCCGCRDKLLEERRRRRELLTIAVQRLHWEEERRNEVGGRMELPYFSS